MRLESSEGDEDEITTKLRALYKNHELAIKGKFGDKEAFDFLESFRNGDRQHLKEAEVRYTQKLTKAWKFGSSWEAAHGLAHEIQFRPHRKLNLRAEWRREGDLLREATYKLSDNWRLAVEWDTEPRSTYSSEEFGGKVKYAGFGKFFESSVGVTKKSRRYDNSSENYNQHTLKLETTSFLTPSLVFETKYELYDKAYATSDPSASYFGRNDDYKQLGFSLIYKASRFAWGLECDFTKLDSSDSRKDESGHDVMLVLDGRF